MNPLCSRDARPQKALVRRAQLETKQDALLRDGRRKDIGQECGGLMAPCARRTRTIGMCSFDARTEGQMATLSFDKRFAGIYGGLIAGYAEEFATYFGGLNRTKY